MASNFSDEPAAGPVDEVTPVAPVDAALPRRRCRRFRRPSSASGRAAGGVRPKTASSAARTATSCRWPAPAASTPTRGARSASTSRPSARRGSGRSGKSTGRALRYFSALTLMCRGAEVPVCWSAQVLGCQSAGVLECQRLGRTRLQHFGPRTSALEHVSTPAPRHPGTEVQPSEILRKLPRQFRPCAVRREALIDLPMRPRVA